MNSRFRVRTLIGATFMLSGLFGPGAHAAQRSKSILAFLMPDEGSTIYDLHDWPGFRDEVKKLCSSCDPIYLNAEGNASLQQQQFDSAIAQGAKAIVIDPVDSAAAASLVKFGESQGVKVIAFDRPIPNAAADYYVSFDNEGIGRMIAKSLVDHLKAEGVPTTKGGIIEINGSPTDAAARLIKKGSHEGLETGQYKTLAEYDTPNWSIPKAQQWTSGQITRFGNKILGVVAANDGTAGGAVAAFKAAGVTPVPPITGNDATVAGLQRIIAGLQYNTISKPGEIEGVAAAKVAVALIEGKKLQPKTMLFNTPTELFTPTLVTAKNIKAMIVDRVIDGKPIVSAKVLCSGYEQDCRKLGITP